MALSRREKGVILSGGASSSRTSSRDRAFGKVLPLLGRSIIVKGFCLTIFRAVRKEKKDFRAETRLALLRFEIAFCRQCCRNS